MSRRIHSVTTLDEYRQYLSGEKFNGDEYTTEDFIAWLNSEWQPSPKMEAGTAVHKLIEYASYGELTTPHTVDGWTINIDLDATLMLPESREARVSAVYRGFELRGRVDSIDALSVRDLKTTRQIDIDRYLESYQWRLYLWMTGLPTFHYDILRVKVDEEEREITITDLTTITLHRYPAMSNDITALLDQYLETLRHIHMRDAA